MFEREILVTNDDGIFAPGLRTLAQLMREYGNVTVVAPTEVQSGMSSSFSMDRTLRLSLLEHSAEELHAGKPLGSLRMFSLTGTPVDCAKMGINMLIDEGHKPDFLASGINHGLNASAASAYSGTLGAAREGAIYGIPSVGFSIDSHDSEDDLSAVVRYSRFVMEKVLKFGVAEGTFLNINFPDLPYDKIRGFRVASQGLGRWEKEFERRMDPRGREYFWIVGTFIDLDTEAGETAASGSTGDHKLVEKGWISVCPMKVDITDYDEMERLRKNWMID